MVKMRHLVSLSKRQHVTDGRFWWTVLLMSTATIGVTIVTAIVAL
jgi:hypothetical protein